MEPPSFVKCGLQSCLGVFYFELRSFLASLLNSSALVALCFLGVLLDDKFMIAYCYVKLLFWKVTRAAAFDALSMP